MKHREPVHKIMATDPLTVHERQKVSEVHQLIVEHNVHHVPVVSGERLIGLISANDLLRVSYGDVDKQDPRQVDALLDISSIREVMREDILTVKRSDTIQQAAELLARGDFHSLPVVDDDDPEILVGLVTSTDLIRFLLEQY